MKLPTIHLNGTPLARLIEANTAALDAVRNAVTALQEVAPHGRDYYPQEEGALGVAIDEWRERMVKLKSVLADLVQMNLYLHEEHKRVSR